MRLEQCVYQNTRIAIKYSRNVPTGIAPVSGIENKENGEFEMEFGG